MEKNSRLMSMTGYGRGEIDNNGIRFLTEIRSVNHRFLEIVVRLPHGWLSLEEAIRKQVQQVIRRGRVDVFITAEGNLQSERKVEVDWGIVESFVQVGKQVEERLGISGSLTIADLINKPECWIIEEPEWDVDEYREALLQSVEEACQDLKKMRQREGRHLAGDLSGRVQTIVRLVDKMKQKAPLAVEHIQNRLHARMQELLAGREFDENRLLTEVAVFADKADITEELIRLESHARQFLLALSSTEPVGRRLDFLIQEMNREANTIGSKANIQSISSLVVDCKSELEKMKEQVQNIE
ncbi:YicC/YloC family endoribonuclease [Paenactinomyces guangxiensis]|uniref:YicC family protein n=1 Tax=Paenactinomyces guangxiensis TaxID=1490290 RepID=A0A7W2A8H8_9BACL|nr:YicC/YloC family endoribonuclease [Paenactinomyces guangxiensis]MBA4494194.1 YicC family protein [Paenactinomyces guangxiensis]MBH8590690.1 YicC family protein [Paenactinomyces guangxiensis]